MARARELAEALRRVREELGRHALALVVDGEHDGSSVPSRRERDVSAAVADGVIDEVAERTPEQRLVGLDGELGCAVHVDGTAGCELAAGASRGFGQRAVDGYL